ncbi:hypothetical protein ES708_31832 [subsurface metagenome]
MEYTEHYDNMAERNNLCSNANSNGFRMLYDNFDPDWQRGDEPHGTLTFTDEPAPIAEPVKDLATKVSKLEARVSKLEKK